MARRRRAARSRGRRQAPPSPVLHRSWLRAPLQAGGAVRGLAEPPEHRQRLRLRAGRRGRRHPVHRHAARRGRGPRLIPARARPPAGRRCGAGGDRGRLGPRGGPSAGHRPSRRQAGEHPHHRRRRREGHRLRHRPGGQRDEHDRHRHHARIGPLLQPRAGPRRRGDRRLGRLLARHRALRDAGRAPTVRGRLGRGGRAQAAHRGPAAADRLPAGPAAGPGGDRHARPGPGCRRSLPRRRRDGGGAPPVPA